MGKIEISEDLRNKLNKVLSYKSADIGDMAVGPAPIWKPPQPLSQPSQNPAPSNPPPPPPQPPPLPQQLHQPQFTTQSSQSSQQSQQMQQQYYIKSSKNKKKKKIKYFKITKIVFVSSIVAGIGLTLGLKIANILFY